VLAGEVIGSFDQQREQFCRLNLLTECVDEVAEGAAGVFAALAIEVGGEGTAVFAEKFWLGSGLFEKLSEAGLFSAGFGDVEGCEQASLHSIR